MKTKSSSFNNVRVLETAAASNLYRNTEANDDNKYKHKYEKAMPRNYFAPQRRGPMENSDEVMKIVIDRANKIQINQLEIGIESNENSSNFSKRQSRPSITSSSASNNNNNNNNLRRCASRTRDASTQRNIKLFIGNIDRDCLKNRLSEVFEKYGQIQEVAICGKKYGVFGVVVYAEFASAELAINKLDGEQVEGVSAPNKSLKVVFFQNKTEMNA